MFYSQTAHVLRPDKTTNRAGEQVPVLRGLENVDGREWRNLQVRPRLQAEREGVERNVTVQEWTVASRPKSGDFDVAEGDVLRLPSGEYASVIGAPSRPVDPVGRGGVHHLELLVRDVGVVR